MDAGVINEPSEECGLDGPKRCQSCRRVAPSGLLGLFVVGAWIGLLGIVLYTYLPVPLQSPISQQLAGHAGPKP